MLTLTLEEEKMNIKKKGSNTRRFRNDDFPWLVYQTKSKSGPTFPKRRCFDAGHSTVHHCGGVFTIDFQISQCFMKNEVLHDIILGHPNVVVSTKLELKFYFTIKLQRGTMQAAQERGPNGGAARGANTFTRGLFYDYSVNARNGGGATFRHHTGWICSMVVYNWITLCQFNPRTVTTMWNPKARRLSCSQSLNIVSRFHSEAQGTMMKMSRNR